MQDLHLGMTYKLTSLGWGGEGYRIFLLGKTIDLVVFKRREEKRNESHSHPLVKIGMYLCLALKYGVSKNSSFFFKNIQFCSLLSSIATLGV